MRALPPTQREPSAPHRPLLLLFWCVGVLLGLFARDVFDTAGEHVDDSPPIVTAGLAPALGDSAEPVSTVVVNVHAVLDLPTATATGTATPRPTATAELTPVHDFCGAVPAAEGAVCRMPLPTATPAPTLPACFSPAAQAGTLCQVRSTPTPTAGEGRDPLLLDGRRWS